MAGERKSAARFAVCLRNEGYEASLERNKLYVLLPDPEAEREGDVRVVDESGEEYLYPADWFVPLEVPEERAALELLVERVGETRWPWKDLSVRLDR